MKRGALLGSGLLVLGCLGQAPPPVVPDRVVPDQAVQAQDPGSVVRSISIVADTTSISAEEIAQLESHGASRRLDNALMAQLAAVGRFGPDGHLQLQISLTRFRLRTAAGALWGGLAGADLLGADVTASGAGRSFEFYTSARTLQGGSLDAAWEVTRLDRLVETLARRIIAGLDAQASGGE